ncbi:lipoprotein LpqH [Mycolicibacterium baixiangningiae]|uniref:lipoprotein LpqH n=1 Tax=Mycolicibacterium baixiangningiae TaxID=2761578 RepID=UPI0018D1A764|nr:lipoprotein LpqH [Mycolicibacterium baixiangningiae]
MIVPFTKSVWDRANRSFQVSARPVRPARSSTVALLAAAALVAAGCSDGYEALGTHTAHVFINGSDIGERPRIRCEQVQWVWYIETLQDAPGFTAQVSTGERVEPRAVQIDNLGGFTGSFWDVTVGSADAEITDGTVIVEGTAEGFYHENPSDRASATFEIRTDC